MKRQQAAENPPATQDTPVRFLDQEDLVASAGKESPALRETWV